MSPFTLTLRQLREIDFVMSQLQVKQTEISRDVARDGESTASDVALAFFNLMYDKKHGMATKSPGPVPKVSKVLQKEDVKDNAVIVSSLRFPEALR